MLISMICYIPGGMVVLEFGWVLLCEALATYPKHDKHDWELHNSNLARNIYKKETVMHAHGYTYNKQIRGR